LLNTQILNFKINYYFYINIAVIENIITIIVKRYIIILKLKLLILLILLILLLLLMLLILLIGPGASVKKCIYITEPCSKYYGRLVIGLGV